MTRKQYAISALLDDPEFMLRVRAAVAVHKLGPHEVVHFIIDHNWIDFSKVDTAVGLHMFVDGMHALGVKDEQQVD